MAGGFRDQPERKRRGCTVNHINRIGLSLGTEGGFRPEPSRTKWRRKKPGKTNPGEQGACKAQGGRRSVMKTRKPGPHTAVPGLQHAPLEKEGKTGRKNKKQGT